MADQKVVDKYADNIAKQYQKGIKDVVETLMKAKGKVSDDEFVKGLTDLPIQDLVIDKMKNIDTELTKAHRDVLKTVTPFGKTKKDD